jgi:hypothetical protein
MIICTRTLPLTLSLSPPPTGTLRQQRAAQMQRQGGTGRGNKGSLMTPFQSGTTKRMPSHQLTLAAQDINAKLLLWEGTVNQTMARTVLSIVADFFTHRAAALFDVVFVSHDTETTSPALPEVTELAVTVFIGLLKYPIPDSVLLEVYPLQRWVLDRYGVSIFRYLAAQHQHRLQALEEQRSNVSALRKSRATPGAGSTTSAAVAVTDDPFPQLARVSSNYKKFNDPSAKMRRNPSVLVAEAVMDPAAMGGIDYCVLEAKVEDWCYEMLRHCAYNHATMRTHAMSLLFGLFRFEFVAVFELSRMEKMATTALSRLTDGCLLPTFLRNRTLGRMHADNVALALHGIASWLSSPVVVSGLGSSSSLKASAFPPALGAILHKMQIILSDALDIAQQESLGSKADPTVLEDLLMQMANVHNHLPEVRIAWLKKLAMHHDTHQQYAEAGQCLIEVAYLMQVRFVCVSHKSRCALCIGNGDVFNSKPSSIFFSISESLFFPSPDIRAILVSLINLTLGS